MNRSLWTQSLTDQISPAWPCPQCSKGILALIPKSLISKETVESKQMHGHEGWDPEWITYVFTAWLRCSYPGCGQEVALAGEGTVNCGQTLDEEGCPVPEDITRFKPLFCWPMPDVFELPAKSPAEVTAELRAAFRLFWSDQSASAGRVRVSLERLMDHYHVLKRRKGTNGKYHALRLHDRIETFSKTQSAEGEKLMALKWLGNTGSHQGDVSRDDLLNGFEILEFLLAELFEQRAVRVAELARELTKRHAPRRKK
jgi:hypothetical protein